MVLVVELVRSRGALCSMRRRSRPPQPPRGNGQYLVLGFMGSASTVVPAPYTADRNGAGSGRGARKESNKAYVTTIMLDLWIIRYAASFFFGHMLELRCFQF